MTDQPAMSDPAARPLHLGLFDIMQVDPVLLLDPGAMFAQRLDDLAHADAHGLDIAFCAERHFMRQHVIPSATTWVAAAAQRTGRIRLGMLGYTLPIRQPVQLAEEVAMADWLASGRIEVGVGLGHREEELVALGVDPARKVPMFQQRVAMLQALWAGGSVTFQGPDITARDIAIWPLPKQEPHPPMWFAGTEPTAASWMGSRGFGLAVGFRPCAELLPTVSGWRAGWAGRSEDVLAASPPRPSGSLALMRHVYVAESTERAMDEITDDLVRLNDVAAPEAGEGGRADRRQAARERAEALVASEVMVAGGPATVAEAIGAARGALGFDLFLANVHAAGVDAERVQRSIRLLGTEVRERLGTTAT